MSDYIENITEKINRQKNAEYEKKAKEYINRILYGIERYSGKVTQLTSPIIVMSTDIYNILRTYVYDSIKYTRTGKLMCCGYRMELVIGRNVLYIAYNLNDTL